MAYTLLALIGMCGYALQGVLTARICRRVDPLLVAAFRGLSLGVTMLPLLFFAGNLPLSQPRFLYLLAAASLLAAFGNWSMNASYRHLRVGTATSSGVGAVTVCSVLFGVLTLNESLNTEQVVCIVLIVLGNVSLGLSGRSEPVSPSASPATGAALIAVYSVVLASAFILVAKLSREFDPFAAAYGWELCIGIIAYLVAAVRAKTGRNAPRAKVSMRDFGEIALASSPTLFGTGCYTLAVLSGPASIVVTIMSTSIVATALLASFFCREHLALKQWAAIFLVLAGIAGLQLLPGD